MDIAKEFEKIRDIPYRIPLAYDEPDECCTGKSKMMLEILLKAGYKARYRLCLFEWNSIALPQDIEKIWHENDSSHTYVEAMLGGEWRVVDPTWDKGLSGLFDINEWDGRSATGIAVKCAKCLSPNDSLKHIKNISRRDAVVSDLKINGRFYAAFNGWLNDYRNSHCNPR